MRRSQKLHVRADLAVFADGDGRDVERREVEVDERPRADVEIRALVDELGGVVVRVGAERAEKIDVDAGGAGIVRGIGPAIVLSESDRSSVPSPALRVVGDVEIAGQHPLPVRTRIIGEVVHRHGDSLSRNVYERTYRM